MARPANKALLLAVAGTVGGLLNGPCGAGAAMAAEDNGGLTFRQAHGAKPASIFQFSQPSIVVPTGAQAPREAAAGATGDRKTAGDAQPTGDPAPSVRSGGSGRGSVKIIPRAEMEPGEPHASPKPRRKPVIAVEPLPAPAGTASTPVLASTQDATSQDRSEGAPAQTAAAGSGDNAGTREGEAQPEGTKPEPIPPVIQPDTPQQGAEGDGVGQSAEASLLVPQTSPGTETAPATVDASAAPEASVAAPTSHSVPPSVAEPVAPADQPAEALETSSGSALLATFAFGFLACLAPSLAVLGLYRWKRRAAGSARLRREGPTGPTGEAPITMQPERGRPSSAVRAAGMVVQDRLAREQAATVAQTAVASQKEMGGTVDGIAVIAVTDGGQGRARADQAEPWSSARHRATIVGMARRAA